MTYYAVFHKGLEHTWILVSTGHPGSNCPWILRVDCILLVFPCLMKMVPSSHLAFLLFRQRDYAKKVNSLAEGEMLYLQREDYKRYAKDFCPVKQTLGVCLGSNIWSDN